MRLERCDADSARPQGEAVGAGVITRHRILRLIPPPELCLVALFSGVIAIFFSGPEKDGSGSTSSGDSLTIHSCRIEGLALSPDGRTAASASRDGTVKVWDTDTRHERGTAFKGKLGYSSVAFSADGRILAAGGFDGRLTLQDVETGTDLTSPPASSGTVRAVVFSPDGATVATGGDDRTIRVWDTQSDRETLAMTGHAGIVFGLAFAPDGKTLVSVDSDGRVIRWDLPSGRIVEQFSGECGPLFSVSVAPDGRSIAFGGLGGITFRELSTGRSQSWKSLRGAVTAVQYLADGKTLASSSLDGAILLWDVSRDRIGVRHSLRGQSGRVKTMAVSPDGMTLVTGGDDAVLRFWDLGPGSLALRRSPESRPERHFSSR
jgi:WD40 repeat protein